MKVAAITLATLCSVVHVSSQTIQWERYDVVKDNGGSLYGNYLDKRVELDTVPMFSSSEREFFDYDKEQPFQRNPYTIGDVEGAVGEAQIQAAREVVDNRLLRAQVDLPLDPRNPSSNSVVTIRVYKYEAKDVPDGGHIAYWALPGGPGLGAGSMYSVIANALQQNLGSIIYIPEFRGSGGSNPLRCASSGYNSKYLRITTWAFALRNCHENHEEPTLQYMSITNAAHDIISLIEKEHVLHPNIAEVRLHGFGFSTLWAQRIMQIKGDLINKVVLEGAVSKSFNFNDYEIKSQTAGGRLLKLCLQDEECKQYFPDGQQSLDKLARVENGCMKVESIFDVIMPVPEVIGAILHLGLKYGQQFDATGNVAIDFRAFALSIAARAIRCDDQYDDLKVVLHAVRYLTTPAAESIIESSLPGFERTQRQFNQVIYNTIKYTEMFNASFPYTAGGDPQLFNARHIFESHYLASSSQNDSLYETDQYLVDFYPQDIQTDVLVIGGELDGQTPIEYGVETFDEITVANGFHKRFAMIPSGAHIVSLNSTCGTDTVVSFFADPSKPVDKCAIGDTTKVNSFEHEKVDFPSVLDPRLSGSSNIWTGRYQGCNNLPRNSCSSPNIRACDACFVACRGALESDDNAGRCDCAAQLAQCLSNIGCMSNQVCLDKTLRHVESNCARKCTLQPSESLAIAGGVMMGISAVALFACWKLLQRGRQQVPAGTTMQEDKRISEKDSDEVGSPAFHMNDL